jgi:hypothetical protein
MAELSAAEVLALLAQRAEDLAVVEGRRVRTRPLLDVPMYRDDRGLYVLSESGRRYVMVDFERPLMEASARVACQRGGAILNVGFGLGFFDEAVARVPTVTRHVIVEAHRQVLDTMRAQGWMDRPGVEVVASLWEDVNWSRYAGAFDGVFFDAYPFEGAGSPSVWWAVAKTILRPGGVMVLYGPQLTEARARRIASELGPHARLSARPCVVEVPFVIPEWADLGVGKHTISVYAVTLEPG